MKREMVIGSLTRMAFACWTGCSNAHGVAPAGEPAPAASNAALKAKDPTLAAAPPSAPTAATAPDAAATTSQVDPNANGWRQFARSDEVPVCLFSTWRDWEKTEFIETVPKSANLRAGHAINFGVFGTDCAAPECIRDATLQCWADVEGSTITLHTRYSGFEKDGATCTTGCASVSAQCNTPLLTKGEYTIVYAAQRWKVRVPSTVHPSCLKR